MTRLFTYHWYERGAEPVASTEIDKCSPSVLESSVGRVTIRGGISFGSSFLGAGW